MGTECRRDRRQTPKVHVYLPLLWQTLINHCYLPPVAHAAFVLHTMRAFLHYGCRQFASNGAAGGWCTPLSALYTCTHGTLHTHTHTLDADKSHLTSSHLSKLIKHTHLKMYANFLKYRLPLLFLSQCSHTYLWDIKTPKSHPILIRDLPPSLQLSPEIRCCCLFLF